MTKHVFDNLLMQYIQYFRWRFVSFVCMAPAKWAGPEDLAAKQDMYENMKTGHHFPANGAGYFQDVPLNPGKDLETLPDFAKSEEGKQMAGVLPYKHEPGDLPDWEPKYNKKYDWLQYYK